MPGDSLFTRRARLAELVGISRGQTIPPDTQEQFNSLIEDAIREITRAHEWEFMRSPDTIELQAKHSGGTISVTDGDTVVTGVGTDFPTGWPNPSYAEFRYGGESYPVASIDSATQITLSQAALRTVSGEAGYSLYVPTYVLSSVYAIESISPAVGGRDSLKKVGIEILRSMKAQAFEYGRPRCWATHSYVAGMPRIELFPVPYYNEFLHVYGPRNPTIPTADDDTDEIPEQWSKVVDLFAQVEFFHTINDDRYERTFKRAHMLLAKMMQESDSNRAGAAFVLDPTMYGSPDYQQRFGEQVD